ncbi:MAG: alpha/beta fold hydrolase [Alcaligenaceae bacterium]|nr:alpha/beta fold hydrolase [Alcaligenaceae bacterium]
MQKPDDTKRPTTELDMQAQAMLARLSGSLSPQSVALAWMDWASHLAASPGKLTELTQLAMEQANTLGNYTRESLIAANQQLLTSDTPSPVPPIQDRRFKDPLWQTFPYNVMQQAFLMNQRWWDTATRDVRGVDPHHADVVNFISRQLTDTLSPANQLLTNPITTKLTIEERGANLVRGLQNFIEDIRGQRNGAPAPGTENFQVGRDVAVTPGKVVLRTPVMELIQYSPQTDKVHPEPILMVPAWIMKYYILDLSPHNSLVRYLVENGHTVFCISWKNPGAEERDLGMDDYLEQGFTAALDAVQAIVPSRPVHATGYCLGGTLLAIAAAALVREGQADRLASLTLLAAQTDFTEPGEISLFIDESQVSMLEAEMAQTGYLRADQMAGAFQMLRSYDLLWSKMVQDYLIGERRDMIDLMAWNADATRMPARMHAQYLRHLFLNNELASSRYVVHGGPVTLLNLTTPTFCVGTTTDHVAPWRSVYKIHSLSPAEITFVLTSGGHNAGIVNPVENSRRRYQVATRPANGSVPLADQWQASAALHDGSWWPEWLSWLKARSGTPIKPPTLGAARKGYKQLEAAPGLYVHER